MDLRRGGIIKEPADQRDPHSATDITREHLPDPYEYEPKAEKPPYIRRDQRGTAQVLGEPPHDGSKHPAAIQRKTRDQVERNKCKVDIGQILDQAPERLNAGNHRLHCVEKDCQGKAHDWAGNRDKKLGDGTGRLGPDLGNPSEDEERNSAHRNFIA